jgi:hypothetical protein
MVSVSSGFVCLLFCFFETESYVVQADLERDILLYQPLEHWDDRHKLWP